MTVNLAIALAFFVGALCGIGIVIGITMLPIAPPKHRRS